MKRSIILTAMALLLMTPFIFAQDPETGQAPQAGKMMKIEKEVRMMGPGGRCGMGMGQHGMGQPGMLLRMADELGLTDNQKVKIKKLNVDNQMAMIDRRAEMQKAQLELRHLMANQASDREVLAAIDRVGTLRTEMQKARYEHLAAVKAVLTTEQLDRLKGLQEKGQHGMKMGPGMRHGRGQGMGMGMGEDIDSDPGGNGEEIGMDMGPIMHGGCSQQCMMQCMGY